MFAMILLGHCDVKACVPAVMLIFFRALLYSWCSDVCHDFVGAL